MSLEYIKNVINNMFTNDIYLIFDRTVYKKKTLKKQLRKNVHMNV